MGFLGSTTGFPAQGAGATLPYVTSGTPRCCVDVLILPSAGHQGKVAAAGGQTQPPARRQPPLLDRLSQFTATPTDLHLRRNLPERAAGELDRPSGLLVLLGTKQSTRVEVPLLEPRTRRNLRAGPHGPDYRSMQACFTRPSPGLSHTQCEPRGRAITDTARM